MLANFAIIDFEEAITNTITFVDATLFMACRYGIEFVLTPKYLFGTDGSNGCPMHNT